MPLDGESSSQRVGGLLGAGDPPENLRSSLTRGMIWAEGVGGKLLSDRPKGGGGFPTNATGQDFLRGFGRKSSVPAMSVPVHHTKGPSGSSDRFIIFALGENVQAGRTTTKGLVTGLLRTDRPGSNIRSRGKVQEYRNGTAIKNGEYRRKREGGEP